MARRIEAATGIETRATILGYMQRGGSPTTKDRFYGSIMGAYAADIVAEGKRNRVISFKGGEVVDIDIEEALAMQKTIPRSGGVETKPVRGAEFMETITSAANSRIKRLCALRQKSRERRKEGVFLIEGQRLCQDTPDKFLQEFYITQELLRRAFLQSCRSLRIRKSRSLISMSLSIFLRRTYRIREILEPSSARRRQPAFPR